MPAQAPTVWSGESGAVSAGGYVYSAIGEWSVNYKADNQAVVDSSTAGGNVRVKGNKDWSGRFKANGYPEVVPGDTFAFIGSIDGVEGVAGQAIVDSIKIEWDVSGSKVVSHEATFSANGVLNEGAAVAVDISVAIPPASAGTVISIADPAASPSWVALAQVETISLEMKCENKSYVDSSTAQWTYRKRGPFDYTLNVKLHPDATDGDTAYGIQGLPQPQTVHGIQIVDGDGNTSTINWVMIGDLSDIMVNRSTQDIVSATMNAAMCGVAAVGGVKTRGSVTLPSIGVVWPF